MESTRRRKEIKQTGDGLFHKLIAPAHIVLTSICVLNCIAGGGHLRVQ